MKQENAEYISIQEFAKKIGYNRTSIYKILNKEREWVVAFLSTIWKEYKNQYSSSKIIFWKCRKCRLWRNKSDSKWNKIRQCDSFWKIKTWSLFYW